MVNSNIISKEHLNCFVDEWVEVRNSGKSNKYYESLGYKKYRNKEGKLVFKVHPWELLKKSSIRVKVRCPICGSIRTIRFNSFINSKSPICASCLYKGRTSDNIGKVYGNLTVIEKTNKRINSQIIWKCLCNCGNTCEVSTGNLQSGNTKSCGCLQKKVISELGKRTNKQNRYNYQKQKGYFIKEDHTEKEINEYLEKTHNRKTDIKWIKLSKKLRENAECTICGSKENLVVHHINGYWEFPEQRYDENNLVVLCNSCHVKYHNSVIKPTKETWKNWVKEIISGK